MIGNDDAMTYEMFLRKAFKANVKGGDSAHLASTDIFKAGGINDVKTGTAYAMAIYINEDDGSLDAESAEKLQDDVLAAKTKNEVVEAIKSFEKDVLHKA